MDLRDEFACQAMNGFLAGYCSNENCAPIDRLSHDRMAVEAYRVADYMIEARKTSEQAESPATDRQQLKAEIRAIAGRCTIPEKSFRHYYISIADYERLLELSSV